MSKYTTEVRFICENYAGLSESVGYSQIDDVIKNARASIFDFDYEIFDADYKPILETKILRHFYTREIGEETVGLWKLRLNSKMNEIMPYYNQLYSSALIQFNPMNDVDYTRSGNKEDNITGKDTVNESERRNLEGSEARTLEMGGTIERNGNSSGTRTDNTTEINNNNGWVYKSDTPQGGITGVENMDYLSEADHSTENNSRTNTGTVGNEESHSDTDEYDRTDTETVDRTDDETRTRGSETNKTAKNIGEYSERIFGKSAGVSYSKMLQEFRETFLNIDMMIIRDLEVLFMQLW